MVIGDRIYDDEKLNVALKSMLTVAVNNADIDGVKSFTFTENGIDVLIFEFTLWNKQQLSTCLISSGYFLAGLKCVQLHSIINSYYVNDTVVLGENAPYCFRFKAKIEEIQPYITTAVVMDLRDIDKRLENGDYMVKLEDDSYIIRRVENHVGKNMIHIDEYVAKSNTVAMGMKHGEVKKIPEMLDCC